MCLRLWNCASLAAVRRHYDRGYYPNYMADIWDKENVHVEMEPGDEELMRKYTADYLGFSYYRTTTHEYGTPFSGDTGGDQGTPNPYLKTTPWGWQIDAGTALYAERTV